MIKSDQEYKRLKMEMIRQKDWIEKERKRLEEQGFSPELILVSVGIAERMYQNLKIEIEEYENIRNGNFDPYRCTIDDIGKHLIRLRIWKGMTQAELAKRLGVTQAQVSRDERFEYQGASLEKIHQVLQALDVKLMFAAPNLVAGQDEMAATG